MAQNFNYEEELAKCRTMQDITGQDGLVQKIIKDAVEHVLGMEMEDYISKEKEKGGKITRNGNTSKNIKTAYGNIGIQVPRTREPGFEPDIIKKRAVIEDGLEPQVISMYAKGMTVRDISEHLQALYGIELSAASISNITDKFQGKQKNGTAGHLTAFIRLYSLTPSILKYVRRAGSLQRQRMWRLASTGKAIRISLASGLVKTKGRNSG